MTTYRCIGAWHKNDGTAATHQAAAMIWPKTLDKALRDATSARVEVVNSMLLCAACQRLLADPKPDAKAVELQRQMRPMLPSGKDATLDYDRMQWCFLSPPPEPISETREDQ